jgi:hypothetical protein
MGFITSIDASVAPDGCSLVRLSAAIVFPNAHRTG